MTATLSAVRPAPSMQAPVGEQLRHWRQRRRYSQLALAHEAGVSTRHLSYLETGRASPSREMVLRLSRQLQVPLRERNRLLQAAGYAPMYGERALDHPDQAATRAAVQRVLDAYEPYPALALDRHWNLAMSNRLVAPLLAGVAPALLQPPVNVLRLSLHPEGLAPRIVDLPAWHGHVLHRLDQQIEASGDEALAALRAELAAMGPGPGEHGGEAAPRAGTPALAVTLVMRAPGATPSGELSFISTTTVFGTPVDVAAAELAIEAFLPADTATAQALQAMAEALPPR